METLAHGHYKIDVIFKGTIKDSVWKKLHQYISPFHHNSYLECHQKPLEGSKVAKNTTPDRTRAFVKSSASQRGNSPFPGNRTQRPVGEESQQFQNGGTCDSFSRFGPTKCYFLS